MAPIVGRAEDRRGNSVANDGKSWTFALPRAQGLLPASAAIVLARTLDRGAPGRVAARVGPLRAGRCLEVAPRAAARFAALVQSTVLASATQLRRSGRVGLRRRRASRLSGERSAVRQNLAGSRSGPGAAYHLEQRGAGPWPGAANSTHRSVGPSGRLAHEKGVSRRGRTRLACRRRAATKTRRRRYFRRSKSQTIRPGRRGHVAGGPESYGGNQSGIRRGDRHHARRLRLVAPLARSGTKAGSQSTGPARGVRRHWQRMHQLHRKVGALYFAGSRGGEAEKYHATEYYLAEAELWLADAGGEVPERAAAAAARH